MLFRSSRRRGAALCLAFLGLGACAMQEPPAVLAAPAPVATPSPVHMMPLQDAVADLATRLVTRAKLPPAPPSGRYAVVVDPWIDRATGAQVASTRMMAAEVAALAPQHFPMLELLPLNQASLEHQPIVLLGAIERRQTPDGRAAYHIYGALADLGSGRIAAQDDAWVLPETVDMTPTAFYRDSPVWTRDPDPAYLRAATQGVGEVIDPAYRQQLAAEALLVEGMLQLEAGHSAAALALYEQASVLPGGNQLRTYSGLYLASDALGRPEAAEAAFGRLVDFGLQEGTLSLKLLFRVGGVGFQPGPDAARYPMWMRQVARHAASRSACLKLTGHASATGSAAANDRLSAGRARTVAHAMLEAAPSLRSCLTVLGVGSRRPLVGSGTDDARDALDRRVDIMATNAR